MDLPLYQDLYDLEEKHFWHISKRKTIYQLIKRFTNSSDLKILDVGCGTGQNVLEFSKLGETWGTDSSKEAINFCLKRGLKNIKLQSEDKIPFPDSTFDVVTLLDVLEHAEEEPLLSEVNRVLKKEGILIIHVPAYNFLWSQWDVILHHKRRYTKSSLNSSLKQNGFNVIKLSYLYSLLLVPALIVRIFKSFISRNYSSDFKLSNPLINQVMILLFDIERVIALNIGIPFGTSVVCVAKSKK